MGSGNGVALYDMNKERITRLPEITLSESAKAAVAEIATVERVWDTVIARERVVGLRGGHAAEDLINSEPRRYHHPNSEGQRWVNGPETVDTPQNAMDIPQILDSEFMDRIKNDQSSVRQPFKFCGAAADPSSQFVEKPGHWLKN
jgi:hypothetical protein